MQNFPSDGRWIVRPVHMERGFGSLGETLADRMDYTRLNAAPGISSQDRPRGRNMTPEERLTRIETLLQATTEHQARQQEQLDRQVQEIDKQNEGIRGLITVARTCLDSIQEMREAQREAFKELRDAQAATDEKLNILIDTVDRIIRRRNGKE